MTILFAPIPSITIVRGTTWSDDVIILDKETGAAVSLVGITSMLMRVRASISEPTLLELSLTNGRLVIVDAATGTIGFRIDSEASLTLPQNDNMKAKYVYDIVIERTPGEYEPAISGKLLVLPQITRPTEPA